MTLVQNTIADTGGNPIAGTWVVITLVAPNGAFIAGTSSAVQSVFTVQTGSNGQWQLNLTPNASLTAGSYYTVSEPAVGRSTAFVVPAGAGPLWLSDIRIPTPPGDASNPVVTYATKIAAALDYDSTVPAVNGQPLVWNNSTLKWTPTWPAETVATSWRVGGLHRGVPYGDSNSAFVVADKEADASRAGMLVRSVGYLVGEVGAAGDDDLHLRVVNGNPGTETYTDGLVIKRASGYAFVPVRLGVGTASPATAVDVAGGMRTAPVALTDAATITSDASTSNHFKVTLGGNRTLAPPMNAVDSQKIVFELIQDATGGRSITLGTGFAFGTDLTAVTLSTTAGKRDYLGVIYCADTQKFNVTSLVRGF